jgi:hypothetical protein
MGRPFSLGVGTELARRKLAKAMMTSSLTVALSLSKGVCRANVLRQAQHCGTSSMVQANAIIP